MVALVMRARLLNWLSDLEHIEARRIDPSVACERSRFARARAILTRKLGVNQTTIENFRRDRLKKLTDLYIRTCQVVAVELQKEASRLSHEAAMAHQSGGNLTPAQRIALREVGQRCIDLANEDEARAQALLKNGEGA
jgi:hypothetical protein